MIIWNIYNKKTNKKLFYYDVGKGKNIIFLPGWGCDNTSFNVIKEKLEKDNHLYLLDLPGFGKSDEPSEDYHLVDYVKVLNNFIIDNKITNPIIVGHSFGCRIACMYSNYYNVKKLVLISAAGIKPKKTIRQLINQKIYKLKKQYYKLTKNYIKYNFIVKNTGSTDYLYASARMKNIMKNIVNKDLTNYYRNIKYPTLLIWGKNDTETKIDMAYKINKLIRNSQLIVFDDAGHYIIKEKSEDIAKLIAKFINESDIDVK